MGAALHPDIKLVAERGGGFLRQTDPAAAKAWCFQLTDRSASRNQPVHRRAQRQRSQTLHLESRPRQNHRRTKQRVPNVGVNPLGPAERRKSYSGYRFC